MTTPDVPPIALAGEPVAQVDENDVGLFIEIIYGENGSTLKRGDKLYAAPTPSASSVPDCSWISMKTGETLPEYEERMKRGNVRTAPAATPTPSPSASSVPVAKIVRADEYGPIIEWSTHWVELLGADLFAAPPANPAPSAEWQEKAKELHKRCAMFPEQSADGFMALLELRNHVEALLQANGATK